MKIHTVLQKIRKHYENGNINFDTFIDMLTESCEKTVIKERVSLIKKFAKNYNLNAEEIESKILPKRKRHITDSQIKALSTLYSEQPILYKIMTVDGVEVFSECVQYGNIYSSDEEGNISIIGVNIDDVPYFYK